MLQHAVFIFFAFAFGACVGSFLNVVVWRLPRVEHDENESIPRSLWRGLRALAHPPSRCPKCNTPLAWYDNIPVFGWIWLRGRCRYCAEPISPRYPIVEAVTGALFVLYYVMFFIVQLGPCAPRPPVIVDDMSGRIIALQRSLAILLDWPMFVLYMVLLACLLAASLIDAELFIIPIEIPWAAALAGFVGHALIDRADVPGALSVGPVAAAMSAGGAVGLIASIVLFRAGLIPQSFPQGEPLLEVDREAMLADVERARRQGKSLEYASQLPPNYTRAQIRAEIGKEMLFLLPPMVLAALGALSAMRFGAAGRFWSGAVAHHWVSGLLGAVLGALVGGLVVWLTRILGTIGFGRVAMGLGDAHLMFGVGAVLGAGAATVAFFLAPFFGILIALYMLLTGTRRELPYGPYLSLATAFVMIFYCPIAAWLSPGLEGLSNIVRGWFGAA